MTLLFLRIFFLVLSGSIGYYIGLINNDPITGIIFSLLGALILMLAEVMLKRVSVRGLSSMVFGLVFGLVMAKLILDILTLIPMTIYFHSVLKVVLTVVFSYLGAVFALRGKDEFNVIIPYVRFRRTDLKESVILLDTSAIIDGRVVDIYKTNFLSGRLVVPRFVLHELQQLADSQDDIKRQRGRRGMELVHDMQKDSDVDVRIHEGDFSSEDLVDLKLIRLAKLIEASICTTDFNLSRMATIQGVEMLNIHDLVNSVRPVVHAGDDLDVNLVKEGKEDNQGIGYLPDGTMVVVSQTKHLIGQEVKVNVTSVLQTQAGRMIFGKLSNEG